MCVSSARAQPPVSFFELPVTGGESALEQLGIRPEERGVALHLLARAMHGVVTSGAGSGLAITAAEILATPTIASVPATPSRGGLVLAPFSDAAWRRVLGLPAGADLFRAVILNRGALLVSAGAMQSCPGFRQWLAGEPRLLQDVVTRWAGAFVQAAPGLQVTGDRVAVPGGPPLDAAWTALVGAPPSRPDEFLRRLLSRDEGHLARFYGTMGRLDEATRTALLHPLPGEDGARALATTYRLAREADAPWGPNAHPYQLSYADLPSVLRALGPPGAGGLPDSAGWWPALLSGNVRSRADARALLQQAPAAAPYAALVRAVLDGSPGERRDHTTIVAMARRAWQEAAPPDAQSDLLYALGHYRRFQALLLMLDRLGVTSPTVWARLVDAALHVDEGSSRERRVRLAAFQGALALVERAHLAGSLEKDTAERVFLSLAATVDSPAPPPAAVRAWLLDSFVPALPPLVRPDRFSGRTAYESRVLQALAGRPLEAPPVISWEGADYTVDVVAAEHERILRIRSQVPSPGLDAALEGRDDGALGAALVALAYAPSLGDPDGAVSLGPEVVERHDFGGSRSAPGRDVAWLAPVERTGIGEPWHVAGSLLGLDLALARSALRRLSLDDMPAIPTVNLNDQLTLARTAVALRPVDLDDATRDELADAIGRGRARVAAAGASVPALLALADEAALTRADRETLAWSVARDPDIGASLFSTRDLLWLGRPRVERATLDRWGVLSHPVDGRLTTRFDAPVPWDDLAGRPVMGVLATQVPDLTLRLVEVTAERRVPAALIPALLLFATQDFWHEVEARFSDDWPAMVRGAAGLPATRIEDFVAALASAGPLRPR
ncbi:MAG: hypothetical protein AB7H81_08585 [Vicinamibacterales bacterium]